MKVREGSVNPLDALIWDGNDSLGVAPSAGSMPTQYHTVHSKLAGRSNSGTRSDYLVDFLGSVTNLSNAAGGTRDGQKAEAQRYDPVGNRRRIAMRVPTGQKKFAIMAVILCTVISLAAAIVFYLPLQFDRDLDIPGEQVSTGVEPGIETSDPQTCLPLVYRLYWNTDEIDSVRASWDGKLRSAGYKEDTKGSVPSEYYAYVRHDRLIVLLKGKYISGKDLFEERADELRSGGTTIFESMRTRSLLVKWRVALGA